MDYLLAFCVSFGVMMIIIPLLIKLAIKFDFLDKPTERKKHKASVPLIGGVAMFISFYVSFSIFFGFGDFKFILVAIGSLLILSIGLVDDWYKTKFKEFAPLPRMLVQLSACLLVFAADVKFAGFANPFNDSYILFPTWLQLIVTVLWIFGVTTVINFSDGLDGLAGGLSAISCCTLFIVAIYMGQADSAVLCITLLGCILGFLKYNLFPAKIFMGDSGATFLGYMLAVISLFGAFKQATLVSIFIPVLALGVPIFDNIFVVFKRFVERKPVYKADASQAHYRLIKKGLNPVQAVMFLFLVSACLNLTSIIILLLKV